MDECSGSQTNLGLVNFASESLDKPQFNYLEILSFILIMIAELYCVKIWCKNRRQKRMEGLRVALSEVQVRDALVQISLPTAPVLALPPPPPQPHSAPLHPQGLSNCGRSPQELLGSKIMQQYN